MASTYTLNNGIELIGTGEQSGTWGDTTNTNLSLVDTALDGQVTVTLPSAGTSGSPNTLAISDGAASDGRNRMVIFNDGGDLGATAYVQLTPNDAEKIIYIRNDLAGSRSIILFQGTYNASNDYEVPAGTTAVIYFDGAGSGAVAANVFNNAYFDGLRLGSVSVTAILDEDNMGSDSATALATQQSIKAYVDSQVTAQDLDFGGDSGTGAVDLDSQTFTIAGTTNEIETSASGQTLTVGLPDDVTIAGDLTVDTDTLYVDSANDRVGVNVAAPTVSLDVSSAAIHSQLRVHRDIAGDNTTMGTILFAGDDSDGNVTDYSRIVGLAESDNSGVEDGQLIFSVLRNASMTEAIRIDSSQRVLINTNTSRVVGGSAEAVTQIYNTSNGALLSLFRDQASNNGGAIIRGGKARNGAIVQDNDTIFSLEAVAHDGTDMGSFAGTIAFLVDGTPGANDTPSRIAFYTTADGSASGSERMRITSAGLVGIGTTSPSDNLDVASTAPTLRLTDTDGYYSQIYAGSGSLVFRTDVGQATAGDTMQFVLSGTEAMRIDSSRRVLMGTNPSSVAIASSAQAILQVHQNATTVSASFGSFANNVGGPVIALGHSRSATVGTPGTVVSSGDSLGTFRWAGDDGTDMQTQAAKINVAVDGTPGANDMPGRLEFYTTADGAASPTERVRIHNDGRISYATTGSGTALSGDPLWRLENIGGGVGEYLAFGVTNRNNNGLNKLLKFHHGYWGGAQEVASVGVVTTSSNAGSGYGFGNLVFYTGSSGNGDGGSTSAERMRITSDGYVGINSSGNGTNRLAVYTGTTNGADIAHFMGYEFGLSTLTIKNAVGANNGRGVSIQMKAGNDDMIGRFTVAHSGSTSNSAMNIQVEEDNATTTYMQFSGDSQRVNIYRDLNFVNNGDGINFGASSGGGSTSTLLDDYEEGAWTPNDGTSAGLTLTINHASYTKIGRVVHVKAYILIPANSATDNIRIGGLPYTNASNNGWCPALLTTNASLSETRFIRARANEATLDVGTSEGDVSKPWSNYSNQWMIFSLTYSTT